MVCTECDTCGGTLHWDWTEAFEKFGFNDGDGQVETWQVESVLREAGYQVEVQQWGLHNTVIVSIKRYGVEQIPYDNPDYTFGYENPRKCFPDHLVELLDRELPPTGDFEDHW